MCLLLFLSRIIVSHLHLRRGSLTGAIVGTTGGPAGTVIGGIAGAFVGAGFETVAEMGMDRLQRLVGGCKK